MKVVVLGSGGREAAIASKLIEHHGEDAVVVLPGNAGTPNAGVKVNPDDAEELATYCREQRIALVIPGGEACLVADLVNRMVAAGGPPVVGPDGNAAQLEGSKIWAKEFMQRHGVATGSSRLVNDVAAARAAVARDFAAGVVIKFDGLAAGKGVWVCRTRAEAEDALTSLESAHGSQVPVVLEELLVGDELSLIGFTDGKCIRLLLPAQDHKQAFDGDLGPNTGGMGAFCPVSWCDEQMLQQIDELIVQPTLRGIQAEELHYRGPLYFGLMVTSAGPKLLEYNARFGDPETQVLLPMLENDLLEIYQACYNGTLDQVEFRFKRGFCVGVVVAAAAYPERSSNELVFAEPLAGGNLPDTVMIFHAGTTRRDKRLISTGGRIFTVSARGETLEQARAAAYQIVEKLAVPAARYRKDIGCRKRLTGAEA